MGWGLLIFQSSWFFPLHFWSQSNLWNWIYDISTATSEADSSDVITAWFRFNSGMCWQVIRGHVESWTVIAKSIVYKVTGLTRHLEIEQFTPGELHSEVAKVLYFKFKSLCRPSRSVNLNKLITLNTVRGYCWYPSEIHFACWTVQNMSSFGGWALVCGRSVDSTQRFGLEQRGNENHWNATGMQHSQWVQYVTSFHKLVQI